MAATLVVPIPQINPSLYAWHPHPTKPNVFRRHALGPETKWARQAPKNRELYLSGLITLQVPCDPIKFLGSAKIAWLQLRYEHPDVVMGPNGEFAEDGSAMIECEIPADKHDAGRWAGRTMAFGTGPSGSAHSEAMLSAEKMMREEEVSDAVCVYLHPTFSTSPAQVFGAGFSFRVGHQMADGMGAYIIAGYFLRFLAEGLGGRHEEDLHWRDATKHLPEPWVKMMNAYQQTAGKEFEANVAKNTALVLETVVCLLCHKSSVPALT